MNVDEEHGLMKQIGQGDMEAFERLYTLYKNPLAHHLYRLIGRRDLVDEILQEVFLRVWKNAPRYRPLAKVSTYLFTIAHHTALKVAAHERPAPMHRDNPAHETDPAHRGIEMEEADILRRALLQLPFEEREALLMAFYQQIPYDEIARVQDVPVGTVKSRIHRAVQRLKKSTVP